MRLEPSDVRVWPPPAVEAAAAAAHRNAESAERRRADGDDGAALATRRAAARARGDDAAMRELRRACGDGAGAVRRYFLGDYGEPTGRTAIVCPTGAAQELGGDAARRAACDVAVRRAMERSVLGFAPSMFKAPTPGW